MPVRPAIGPTGPGGLRRQLRRARRAAPSGVWLVTAAVVGIAWTRPSAIGLVAAAVAGTVLIALAVWRIDVAASVLLLGILFNTAALSLAFRAGLPVSVVKGLSFWKEGILAAVIVVAFRRRHQTHLDRLDIAALVLTAIGLVYVVIPGSLLGDAGGVHPTLYERSLAWRNDVLPVAVVVAFRHLRLPRRTIDVIVERFVGVVIVVAVIGIFEAVLPGTWNDIAVHGIGLPRYEQAVVGYQPSGAFSLTNVVTYVDVGGHLKVRIGSILFDYLAIGFVFAIALGITGDLIARGVAKRWVWVGFPLLLTALALTQTRSAIIAGVLATIFALRRRTAKPVGSRVALSRALAVVLLVGVPVVALTGSFDRFVGADTSNAAHSASLTGGLDTMVSHPLGRGLGTAAGAAQLLGGQSGVKLTEDQYLQVGTQLGLLGLGCYLTVMILTLRRLLDRRRDTAALAPSAMANVGCGVAVGLIFTQAFINLELAIAFWALAGLAVSIADRCEPEGEIPVRLTGIRGSYDTRASG